MIGSPLLCRVSCSQTSCHASQAGQVGQPQCQMYLVLSCRRITLILGGFSLVVRQFGTTQAQNFCAKESKPSRIIAYLFISPPPPVRTVCAALPRPSTTARGPLAPLHSALPGEDDQQSACRRGVSSVEKCPISTFPKRARPRGAWGRMRL